MGIFDKAKDLLGQHGDKADKGLDKASDFAKEKTGGKYDEHIDKAGEKAREQIDQMNQEGGQTGGSDPRGDQPR